MLPLVEIPPSIQTELGKYREIFFREAGFNHIGRYISGLLLSENKTLQGTYSQWVFLEGEQVSSRAMHQAVFEAGWSREQLMKRHRQQVASQHRGRGREVVSIDWTLAHHERAKEMYGAKKGYDYVNNCPSCYQTVMTAVVANSELIDGIAVEVQMPNYEQEELAYLQMSARESYEQMEQVYERLSELLHYQKNRLAYRKRTEMAVEIVQQLEEEGQFPQAAYAFDNGVLSRPLTELIESSGKVWVSEIERSRLLLWDGNWQRAEWIDAHLRDEHPESFRRYEVKYRNGDIKTLWIFSKTLRLKKYGRKRLVIVHEQEDLQDAPRFLLTNALHWDASRTVQTWSYRWPVEIFHQFTKQSIGFESAQLRKEEAVKRHFCLSCVAQSILQRVLGQGRKSERFKFADTTQTIGQRLYALNREALASLLRCAQSFWQQGHSVAQLLEVLMPA